MKIAIFSDVQANFPAMETVTEHILNWSPDSVIMNGDLVNRGPESLKCLQLFESLKATHDWIPIRGNHEDFILNCSKPSPGEELTLDQEMTQFTVWAANQLGDAAKSMSEWPDQYRFTPEDSPSGDFQAMHGSMLGNRIGIMQKTTDEQLAERVPEGVNLFATAHTHRPLIREYNGCTIVNVGSAGSPFDHDPRASYAQLTYSNGKWNIEIIRIDYDRKAAEKDYFDSGFIDDGGPMAKMIYHEWQKARSLMQGWRDRYYQLVSDKEMSLKQSVDEYIASLE